MVVIVIFKLLFVAIKQVFYIIGFIKEIQKSKNYFNNAEI